MLASRKFLNYVSLITIILSIAACNKNNNTGDGTKQEGISCTNSNECTADLICADNVCSKICNNHNDCAKYQYCLPDQKICRNNPDYQCSADEDCTSPGQCYVQRGAICQGGTCIYKPKEAGATCDDEILCTTNDLCDGAGNCSGNKMICDAPPKSYCLNDETFRDYKVTGTCIVKNGAPQCEYTFTDRECQDCPEACGNFCDNVDCRPLNQPGLCYEQVCDYKSQNDPPCSPRAKENGSVCKYKNENTKQIMDGFCQDGTCVECTQNEHCLNTSSYPECQTATCENNHCFFTRTSGIICGKKDDQACKHGQLFSGDGTCSEDGSKCDAPSTSCDGYNCNATGDACLTECTSDSHCQKDYYCDNSSHCTPKAANGQICIAGNNGHDCQSGHCDILNNKEGNEAICCPSGDCCLMDNECPNDQKCDPELFTCISGNSGSVCQNDNQCKEGLYCPELSKVCTPKIANGQKICNADKECLSGHCDLSSEEGPDTNRCCESGECCGNRSDCPADYVCKNGSCVQDDSGQPCNSSKDCNYLTSYCAPNEKGEKVCTTKKENGLTCNEAEECGSSYCVKEDNETSGVCCNELCTEPGRSCSSKSFPRNNGQCLYTLGQICDFENECQSGICMNEHCCGVTKCSSETSCSNNTETYFGCGDNGTCEQRTRGCGKYKCNVETNSCWKQCTGSHQCADDYYCNENGECQPKLTNGNPCGTVYGGLNPNDSCIKGFCADGVCCDEKCAGLCESCNQAGAKKGTCSPIIDDYDEDTCNSDGTGCGGTGHSCKCGRSPNTSDIVCRHTIGSTCSKADDCSSGNCVDGVCCDSPCNERCQSCNQPGLRGTCSPVLGHIDPGTCDNQNGSCKNGMCICDGGGKCRSSSSRSDPSVVKADSFDDCAWGNALNNSITINGQSVSGYYCAYGQPAGSPCSANNFPYYTNNYAYSTTSGGVVWANNIDNQSFINYPLTNSAQQNLVDKNGKVNNYYQQTTLIKNVFNNLTLTEQPHFNFRENNYTLYEDLYYSRNQCYISYYYSNGYYNQTYLDNCAPAQGGGICESGICLDRCCKEECDEDYCYREDGKYYLVAHYCDKAGACQSQTALADQATCKGYRIE